MVGTVQGFSPSGAVARIRMDGVADSYAFVTHLSVAD